MRYIGFALEPGLIGSHALERGSRETVPDMDLSIESIPPIMKALHIAWLRYRLPWCDLHALLLHSVGVSEFDKGFGHEFSAFVVLQLLDLCLKLVLSKCLVGLESIKGVAFSFELQCGTVG